MKHSCREILDDWEASGAEKASQEEVSAMLRLSPDDPQYFRLLCLSHRRSRAVFGNRGYIFAQIGINAEPCSGQCAFCSMAASHFAVDGRFRKDASLLCREAEELARQGIDDLFLMTTADFPQELFLTLAAAVRRRLPAAVRLVANIGDLDDDMARRLRATGCTGAYHIRRLREGIDTALSPAAREATLAALRAAGLRIYYCIEPIGPEHSPDELAREILFARELHPEAMAVMRRVPVPGTPKADSGCITALELVKIAAIANLVTAPSRCMNVHEPMQAALLAGVNQFYAESGANPRDTAERTELGRGLTPAALRAILREGDWQTGTEQGTA